MKVAEIVAKKLKVYFTVDTETSMGGAWKNAGPGPLPLARTVFGENGTGSYGIPLIMDILEEHSFRATFFIEVFCSYLLGFEEVRKVFQAVQLRGHDVQLHLHPVQRFYRDFLQGQPRREKDLMFQFPPEEQRALIREGVELFERLSGKAPRAFRAGCYGASEATLVALRENGVLIDSSYNLAYLDQTCGFRRRPLNRPETIEGVLEFPVTNFQSGSGGFKPLEISAVSVSETLATIRALRKAGGRDAVLVFHSFSFLKNRGVRFENSRPDRIVIRRFRKLCAELAKMSDEVEVALLGDADVSRPHIAGSHLVPSVGWIKPALRKAVQGLDRIPWI